MKKPRTSPGFPLTRAVSPSQTESPDDFLVSLRAPAVQVGEQPSALSDHAEQPAATGVVVAGGAQMFGEVLDSLGKERDLDLRRAGVLVVTAVRRDHLILVRERRCRHPLSFLDPLDLLFAFESTGCAPVSRALEAAEAARRPLR